MPHCRKSTEDGEAAARIAYDRAMTLAPRRIATELLFDGCANLGEGPTWDAAHSRVLWVDINEGCLYATGLDGSTETVVRVDGTLSAVAERGSGGLLLARPTPACAAFRWQRSSADRASTAVAGPPRLR